MRIDSFRKIVDFPLDVTVSLFYYVYKNGTKEKARYSYFLKLGITRLIIKLTVVWCKQ